MPTSSSSSMVVDLGEAADVDDALVDLGAAADLDDATSKLFFSDVSAAVSWPAVSEIASTLRSPDSLVALCSKHGVPSELTPVCAEHLGWRACTPPPLGSNKMCVYAAALDAGLRFPLHEFYSRVLRHFHLAPSQLTPNSWTYLAAFVLRCQDAGVEPLVSAFRHFFTICAQTHKGEPTGCHHFQQSSHDVTRRLFTGYDTLPRWTGWKSRFFFLDCPSGWKCLVKWGKPKRKDARRVQLTSTVIHKLKAKGSIDIKLFLANREMPVGDPPLQSARKVEAEGAGPGDAAADNASTTTSKRSRLSPTVVLSQPQPLPTSAPSGFAPIRASSTGGLIPPSSLPPIRASSTGGHFPPQQRQSLGESASAPRELPGMRARVQAVSIEGSSQVTPPAPHTMCGSDAWLQLWEAKAKASEQAALIAKLNQELHVMKTWNTQWHKELRAAGAKHAAEIAEIITHFHAANDRNNHLNGEIVQLNKERNQLIGYLHEARAEVAQLKADHAAESTQLKDELEDEAKQRNEDLAEDLEQFKHEHYMTGANDMRDLVLTMYKFINPNELKVEHLLHQGASLVAPEDQ